MVLEATFRHGKPVMVDYENGSTAVTAGDVVPGLDGGLETLIAHHDIPANTKGALAAGGGVYSVECAAEHPLFTPLYWDDTNSDLATSGDYFFGYNVTVPSGAGEVADVLHTGREPESS